MPEFEDRFEHLGLRKYGVLAFPDEAALVVLAAAEENGVAVLGVDAFEITDEYTRPLDILDLSAAGADPRTMDSWGEARRFIRERWGRGQMFELVLDG